MVEESILKNLNLLHTKINNIIDVVFPILIKNYEKDLMRDILTEMYKNNYNLNYGSCEENDKTDLKILKEFDDCKLSLDSLYFVLEQIYNNDELIRTKNLQEEIINGNIKMKNIKKR